MWDIYDALMERNRLGGYEDADTKSSENSDYSGGNGYEYEELFDELFAMV
jgi:hypothetical protein